MVTTISMNGKTGNRVRSKSVTSAAVCHILDTSIQNGAVSYPRDRIISVNYRAESLEMTDVVSPRFSQRISDGAIINNPMSSVKITFQGGDSGGEVLNINANDSNSYRVSLSQITGTAAPWPYPSSPNVDMVNLKRWVQTQALAKVNSSGFQGMVAVAELGKTFSMLLHPLQGFTRLFSWVSQNRQANRNIVIDTLSASRLVVNGKVFLQYKPIVWRGPGRVVKAPKQNIVIPAGSAISGAILANNLGLRPLMMDIEAILKTIPKLHEEKRQTYRAKYSLTESNSRDVLLSCYGTFTAGAREVTTHDILVRSSILAADRFDVLADFGLSAFDIFGAAWELIPYSFILDYFGNIGTMLDTLRPSTTSNILAASTSTTIDSKIVRTYTTTTPVAGYNVTKSVSGQATAHVITKTRDVGLESIGLAYNPRPFRATVIQNLLSLMVQQLTHLGSKRTPFH